MQSTGTSAQPSILNKELTQLNQTISILLENNKTTKREIIDDALKHLFNTFVWAEQKNSSILEQLLQISILKTVVQNLDGYISSLITGFTLIFGNCKPKSQLSQYLLENRLGDSLLIKYVNYVSKKSKNDEEEVNRVVSFMRSYHSHLDQQKLDFYISEGHFWLFEIGCKFFNCPEDIPKTTILNIIMSLLKITKFREDTINTIELLKETLKEWCIKMCKLFRNELKDLDQQLLVTKYNEQECIYFFHIINDKILLWEDLSQIAHEFLSECFYQQVILPLLIGALNMKGVPLFSLKFSLFVLNKLTKTISTLGLLEAIGKLLFIDQTIIYQQSQLQTAALKSFNLRKLLQPDELIEGQNEEQIKFTDINKFFLNILKSKDSSFLESSCSLLMNLLIISKNKPVTKQYFQTQLGFGLHGRMVQVLTDILINQLTAFHSLETIRIICHVLLSIQPNKYLVNESCNLLTHIFKGMLYQVINLINKNKQYWAYLSETLEYDLSFIVNIFFDLKPSFNTRDFFIFNDEFADNDDLPFYKQRPQAYEQLIRYQLLKCIIVQQVCSKVIEDFVKDQQLAKYAANNRKRQQRYIKSGELLKMPIECESYKCKMIDKNKENIQCILLDDVERFILCISRKNEVKVIYNVKTKHTIFNNEKKEKYAYQIKMNRFDQKTQGIILEDTIVIKGLQYSQQNFNDKKLRAIYKQMQFFTEYLNKCLKRIPSFSLL